MAKPKFREGNNTRSLEVDIEELWTSRNVWTNKLKQCGLGGMRCQLKTHS